MTDTLNTSIPDISLRDFLIFLKANKYEICMKNPLHVAGQGYSPNEYYRNVNIDYALDHLNRILVLQKERLEKLEAIQKQ
jgi:hypothetical protein